MKTKPSPKTEKPIMPLRDRLFSFALNFSSSQISSRWETLNPTQIPAIAPSALKKREENEKTLPPQSIGTYPPAIDPTTSPVIMKVLAIEFFLCGNRIAKFSAKFISEAEQQARKAFLGVRSGVRKQPRLDRESK